MPSLIGDKLVFGETGALIDGRYSSYDNILWNQCEQASSFDCSPSLFPKFTGEHPSWMPAFSDAIGQDISDLSLLYSHREEAPPHPNLYLERGVAYFGAGEYDLALKDYQEFTVQNPAPHSVADFSLGFAKGLPKGIYESGEGLFLFLADFVQHPVQTSSQVVDSVKTLVDLVRQDDWGVVAESLAPEVHQLVTQWDTLSSDQRGELAGYAIGKHGADILVPGALAKVASKSVKSAQELAAVCKNLHIAQETLVLETAAGIGSSAKIGEIVHAGQTIAALGEDLGFTAREMGQLQQAGSLEKTIANACEHLSPHMRESFDLFKKAQTFLEQYKGFIPESQARELIRQPGIRTFPRPQGIPENFRVKISKKGAGMVYVHPNHTHTLIRVMPGKPHSPLPHQQKPYVNYTRNGKDLYRAPSGFVNLDWLRLCQIDLPRRPSRCGNDAPRSGRFGCVSRSLNSQNLPAHGIDRFGNIVEPDSPAAHIPYEAFVYRD